MRRRLISILMVLCAPLLVEAQIESESPPSNKNNFHSSDKIDALLVNFPISKGKYFAVNDDEFNDGDLTAIEQNRFEQAEAMFELGETFTILEDYKQALLCYENAISGYDEAFTNNEKLNKQTKNLCLYKSAKCHFALGDNQKANEILMSLENETFDEATEICELAELHENLNNNDEAEQLYKKSIEQDQLYKPAYNKLQKLYTKTGNQKGAEGIFKQMNTINFPE